MKRLKLWAGLLILFISGIVLGASGSWVVWERHALERVTGRWPKLEKVIMRELDRELGLSVEQREAIVEILCRTHLELNELRRRNRPEREQIMERGAALIKAELSPEQQGKFDILHERMKHRRADREDRFERGPGAGPPPCE